MELGELGVLGESQADRFGPEKAPSSRAIDAPGAGCCSCPSRAASAAAWEG